MSTDDRQVILVFDAGAAPKLVSTAELESVSGALVLGDDDTDPAYYLYMARLSSGSRPAMRGALDRCARYLTERPGHDAQTGAAYPWRQIRSVHAHLIRARLQAAVDNEAADGEKIGVGTGNKALAGLRGIAKVCFHEKWISGEDYAQIKHIPSIRGASLGPATGRMFTDGEIAALFAAAQSRRGSKASRMRDVALLAILYGGGLRRAEARTLDVADYDGQQLKVMGKGKKQRLVPLPEGARRHVDRWLELRCTEAGPLLCTAKGGINPSSRLSLRAIDRRLQAVQKAATGLKPFTAHDFRRTFASTMLERGADVSTVQRLLGHADPKTTTQYDRRGEGAKRKAVDLLFVPFDEGGRDGDD